MQNEDIIPGFNLAIEICIDNREQSLYKQIQYYLESLDIFSNQKQKIPINISVKPLSLGDVIIKVITRGKNDEMEEREELIIERKSIQDLLSSIKDGRYEEQSFRLNGSDIHNHNILYLVEGNVSNTNYNKSYKSNSNDKFIVYSAIFSLNYYKGFSVIRTFNLEESALYICNSANKLRKGMNDKKKGYYANLNKNIIEKIPNEVSEENKLEIEFTGEIDRQITSANINTIFNNNISSQYTQVIKKVKKDNITPDNIGEIMLCQIPGISSITAVVIMNKFKTIDNLIKNIKESGNECLKEITYTNNDKTRKISKSSIDNILKFLGN
jgi:ERCC4-type nuclease